MLYFIVNCHVFQTFFLKKPSFFNFYPELCDFVPEISQNADPVGSARL